MNVKEAQQFVADYAKGEFAPTTHAAFLQWLRVASTSELDVIATEHESRHGQWVFSADEPSREWVEALEVKLDRLAEKRKKALDFALPFAKKVWIAAASVTILVTAGIVWYRESGGSLNNQQRQQVLATLTKTIDVPKSGLESITLPDGSKVWLNSASTLRYPAKFSGKDRVVALTGEAYFEVTQRSDMPFRVLIRDAEVEVLGTHFNVMAYDNEPVSQTTLIDGSVRVESGSQEVKLHPGEQGEIPYPSPGATGPIKVIPGIDPTTAIAWKDGDLKFKDASLHAVMRTLERCYNVEIQVDQNVPERPVTANFSRSWSLDQILTPLEKGEHLHFINYGTKVRVTLAK